MLGDAMNPPPATYTDHAAVVVPVLSDAAGSQPFFSLLFLSVQIVAGREKHSTRDRSRPRCGRGGRGDGNLRRFRPPSTRFQCRPPLLASRVGARTDERIRSDDGEDTFGYIDLAFVVRTVDSLALAIVLFANHNTNVS